MNAIDRIRAERLVAVLRRVGDIGRVAEVLAASGVRVVEVTLDSEGGLEAIAGLRRRGDVTVLAGTVRTVLHVESALAAGAEACVGPSYSEAVVRRCVELGLPAIPGALTASEVDAAWQAGAAMVKLFPADAVGPGYVEALLKPLRDIPLLCTGGVRAENAAAFLAAGAAAVGVSFRAGATEADARRVLEAVRSA